jgi:hypothetical protein
MNRKLAIALTTARMIATERAQIRPSGQGGPEEPCWTPRPDPVQESAGPWGGGLCQAGASAKERLAEAADFGVARVGLGSSSSWPDCSRHRCILGQTAWYGM